MDYKPSLLFRSGHLSTCFPTIFRKVEIKYERERIDTSDGDFLDIDWVKNNNQSVLVLCHGLEGSSNSNYIKGIAKYFSARNWDILVMNYRGCSGEMNKKIKFYNMGQIEDLALVLDKTKGYKKVVLAGFSLGGGLVLNYLGKTKEYTENLKCAIAVSAPCDAYGSSKKFDEKGNLIYRKYFLNKLKSKMEAKLKIYPDNEKLKEGLKANSIEEFDNLFTSAVYGYKDAVDYYNHVSANKVLKYIKIPTLILMAKDDPIMSDSCYPVEESKENKNITLQITKYGGHVGYVQLGKESYWLEERMYEYIKDGKI